MAPGTHTRSDDSGTRTRRGTAAESSRSRTAGDIAATDADVRSLGRRRRLPVLAILVFVIAVGAVLASVNPYAQYRQAKREQAAMEEQVALLEQENAVVQTQIDRLKHDTYLETLARSELNLARPGEDVFIVTGGQTTTDTSAPAPEPGAGPLEKMVDSIRSLF